MGKEPRPRHPPMKFLRLTPEEFEVWSWTHTGLYRADFPHTKRMFELYTDLTEYMFGEHAWDDYMFFVARWRDGELKTLTAFQTLEAASGMLEGLLGKHRAIPSACSQALKSQIRNFDRDIVEDFTVRYTHDESRGASK